MCVWGGGGGGGPQILVDNVGDKRANDFFLFFGGGSLGGPHIG